MRVDGKIQTGRSSSCGIGRPVDGLVIRDLAIAGRAYQKSAEQINSIKVASRNADRPQPPR